MSAELAILLALGVLVAVGVIELVRDAVRDSRQHRADMAALEADPTGFYRHAREAIEVTR